MSAVTKLNEQELQRSVPDSSSWHNDYKDTAWVKVFGLAPELTEGDVICVFSQLGEIEDIELIRDANTGKSKGLCFIKFEQYRSAVLTVDNFNDAVLLDRTLRVDHHRSTFRRGKKHEGLTLQQLLHEIRPGHSYENKEIDGTHSLSQGVDVYGSRREKASSWKVHAASAAKSEEDMDDEVERKRAKKERKQRKKKETKKHKRSRVDND